MAFAAQARYREYMPFSEKDWANLLDISTKSLQWYK